MAVLLDAYWCNRCYSRMKRKSRRGLCKDCDGFVASMFSNLLERLEKKLAR